jgi:hypothetical protein
MQHLSHAPRPAASPAAELAAALHLIAHGTGNEKVSYIAERDPDWFVDHLLVNDYVDRDTAAPESGVRVERALLDQSIARIALRDRTFDALRATA